MDFKKRLIEELDLSTIQAQTMYSDYIDVCEKLAKEYHKRKLKNHGVIGDVVEQRELFRPFALHIASEESYDNIENASNEMLDSFLGEK